MTTAEREAIDVRALLESEAAALEEQIARLRIRRRVWPQEYRDFQKAYYNRPAAFVAECLMWKRGQGPAVYQTSALENLVTQHRECVRICHGAGKTAEAAWAILWFALTRDGEDWKLLTTASAWRQLDKYLWPEVHKWARRINWNKVGRGPFNERYELLKTSLSLSTGEAFAVASNMPEKIEGAHADKLFYLFDEAKTIPDQTWDAVEGAFSNAGTEGIEIMALAQSTPGDPVGRFYDIQSRKPGFEDWHADHIKLELVVQAGRVSQEWVDQRRKQWGETSAIYQNRVLGEFATNASDGIIPLTWIELANERWLAWKDLHDQGLPGGEYPKWTGVGGDVGGGGDASTAAHRYEWLIEKVEKWSTPDTMSMVGKIVGILKAKGGYAVVDVIGIGAGVVSRAKELGVVVWPFNASLSSTARDSTRTLEFVNLRAESWWALREQLDPSMGATLALPPDDELSGDLSVPTYKQRSNGIQVESKDELRKPTRLGRSTDKGDAVVMIMAPLPSVQGSGHGMVSDYLAAYQKMLKDKQAKKEAQ